MRLVLILLRHGEAVEGSVDSKDHGRVLTGKGQQQAVAVGQHLQASGQRPSLALVSDAARTQQTWAAALSGGAAALASASVRLERLIYTGETAQLAQLLAEASAPHASVILVGHNPGISELASDLSGQYLRFATGECVVLAVQATSWAEAIDEQRVFEVVSDFKPAD